MPAGLPRLMPPAEGEWTEVQVPEVRGTIYSGQMIRIPEHKLYVANILPVFENDQLAAGMTQAETADFIGEHNSEYCTNYMLPKLFQDNAIRAALGERTEYRDWSARRGSDGFLWGYCADFVANQVDIRVSGVGGQIMMVAEAFWRLPHSIQKLGLVTIPTDGMVPEYTKREFRKIYGPDGLRRLGELRGYEIFEGEDQILSVTNPIGIAQLTLPHNEKLPGSDVLIRHSCHQHRPGDAGEAVVVSEAYTPFNPGRMCSDISYMPSETRDPGGSFHLVRGREAVVTVTSPCGGMVLIGI